MFPTGVGQSDTRAVTLSDGRPNPHSSAGTNYATITGAEIVKLVLEPQEVPKTSARWFMLSTYVACDAREHAVQRERGSFWWLCVDIDQNNLALTDVSAVLDAVAPGAARLVYSTRSSTADARRWRAMLPLREALTGADYTDTALAFFAELAAASGGALLADPKLALTGQLTYLPNRGAFYEQEILRAPPLALPQNHPVIRRRDADRVVAEAARREAAEHRRRKAAERLALGTGDTPVDAFNAANKVSDLLERYGYARLGQTNSWRSPHQTSGTYATRDFGDHWVSLSGSDASHDIGAPSTSGARFGDGFDLFVAYEHAGDFEAAVMTYVDEHRVTSVFNDAKRQSAIWPGPDPRTRNDPPNGVPQTTSDEDDAVGLNEQAEGTDVGLRLPKPFLWVDPALIPPRPWLYGRHLLRQQVSITVAPGGIGKSSNSIVEALAMATGRRLLGEWVLGPLRVWLYNLEDPAEELQRRITAAMVHHQIAPDLAGGRLFVDSGRDRPLCTAFQMRLGTSINVPELDAMTAEMLARQIDVLIVDPFVSSHQVNENDNGAIDLVAKQYWVQLAHRCNCAVELVHHTRKLGGEDGTSEAGRGASALLGAARSGRVLNRMTAEDREKAGIGASDSSVYFSLVRDKANLAPSGKREWRRLVSVDLANGDSVGVVEKWDWPDDFAGISARDLHAVQQAIDASPDPLRYSDQASPWVGKVIADVLGIDVDGDRKRIRRMVEAWLKSGALVKRDVTDDGRRSRPCILVGEGAV